MATDSLKFNFAMDFLKKLYLSKNYISLSKMSSQVLNKLHIMFYARLFAGKVDYFEFRNKS